MLIVVVDEGDEKSTPTKSHILCQSPYIRMHQVKLASAPVSLVGEWKLVLLPKLARFTNLGLLPTKLWQTEHYLFRLQFLKPILIIDIVDPP